MYEHQRNMIRHDVGRLEREIKRLRTIMHNPDKPFEVRMEVASTVGWLEGVAQSLAITVDSDERVEAKRNAASAVEAVTA